MDNKIMYRAKEFLINTLKGKDNEDDTIHPWRNGWEFRVGHSLRVLSYAEQILEGDSEKVEERDKGVLRLAALLHDIGRVSQRENRAQIGADLIEKWIEENHIELSEYEKNLTTLLIKNHSNKKENDGIYISNVLKDADTLDEIGVMSIFMCGNWIDKSNPYYFKELLKRLRDREIPYCDKSFNELRTITGKEILLKKKSFIEEFIAQLEGEIEGEY